MSEFSFKRDFKSIMWKETLQVNFFRALFAGPVLVIVGMLMGMSFSEASVYLLFPFMYFVVLLPFGLFFNFLASLGIPYIGWMAMLFSLMVAVGDPFVATLKRYVPSMIPVEKFGIFNLMLIIFCCEERSEVKDVAFEEEG